MRAAALFLSLLLLGSSLAAAAPVQAAETAPPGHEGTVYFSSAAGTDGTRFFVSLLWDDMPKLFGRPAHNADRTFYPGDLLRVSVVGRMSAGYERFVLVSGAAGPKTILVGETFSVREDLQIRADAPSGLRDINFTLYPKQGRIDVTVLDENGGMGRGFFINGKAASAGTLYLDQGSYIISFEEPPENVLAPPAENITLTPGRRVSVVARYCCTADNQPPQTRVVVLENGAATYLPTLVATLRVIVVPYNPRFVVVPYLCFDEAAASSYEMPFSVFIRYDGNQYDPDNENRISLDQRMVVDGISLEGYALWPLRSAGEQQRYHDNGEPAFLENGDPEMYRELEELRYDNGMSKYEVATITAVLDRDTAPFVCFSFYAKYTRAENVKEQFYSQEETCGTGPFSWLRVHGVQLEGETSIGAAKVIKFVDETENPLVFDDSNRYHKFVFSLQNQAQQWVAAGEGELSLKVSFWTTASRRQAFRAEVKWSAFSPH
ncbi:MAG: hypothetical protein QW835_03780, partial [Candidatus Hadarchaeum sp.]